MITDWHAVNQSRYPIHTHKHFTPKSRARSRPAAADVATPKPPPPQCCRDHLADSLHPHPPSPLRPPDDDKHHHPAHNSEDRQLVGEHAADRDDEGGVVRVPRRAAEVVKDGRLHLAVEAVEAEVVGRAGEDLEGRSVGLVGVDGSGGVSRESLGGWWEGTYEA